MAIAAIIAIIGTVNGVGISPDSTIYLSAADHLVSDGTLDTYSGQPLTAFPPGYPLLIAGLIGVGGSSDSAARVLCVIVAGLLPVPTFVALRRVCSRRGFVAAGVVFVAVMPTVTRTTIMAWTEPIFALVLLAIIALLVRLACEAGIPGRSAVLGLASLTSAAVLLRYVGLGVMPAVATALVIVFGLNRRVVRIVGLYCAGASVIPALLIARNYWITGTIGGPQVDPRASLTTDVRSTFREIARWFLATERVPSSLVTMAGLFTVAAIGVIAALAGKRRWPRNVAESSAAPATVSSTRLPLALMAMSGIMLTFILLSARRTWVSIDARMLMPLMAPVVISALIGLDALCRESRRWVRTSRLATVPLAVVLLIGSNQTMQLASAGSKGIGYNSEAWRSSELTSAVSKLGPVVVFSSNPDGIWAQTRREPILLSPRKTGVGKDEPLEQLAAFAAAACDAAYLAWFKNSRDYLYTPAELSNQVTLEPTAFVADGVLYRVSGRSC
jgi:hypothetical protein